jgi:hypothetical protein
MVRAMASAPDLEQSGFPFHPAVTRILTCALACALVVTAAPVPAVADAPPYMELFIRDLIAQQRREAIERELEALDAAVGQSWDPEQALIDEIQDARLDYAETIREAAASAMTPLALIASVFAIESATDVFLTLFPFGKAAGLVKDLRKARKAKKARKAITRNLFAALDDRETKFVRAARHLPDSDLSALVGITKRVKNPETVVDLMTRAARGEADLAWIEKKLNKGTFDSAFVEHYTRFDAYPSWRQLQGVIDNQVSQKSRKSFMSKIVGFLGEEGAARHAVSDTFMRRHGLSKSMKVQRGHKGLDLIVVDAENQMLVVAEVKNWGATWSIDEHVNRLYRQLSEHDAAIRDSAFWPQEYKTYKVKRLLMVEKHGYDAFTGKAKFEEAMKQKPHWQIEIIPGSMIEGAREFIDRMR